MTKPKHSGLHEWHFYIADHGLGMEHTPDHECELTLFRTAADFDAHTRGETVDHVVVEVLVGEGSRWEEWRAADQRPDDEEWGEHTIDATNVAPWRTAGAVEAWLAGMTRLGAPMKLVRVGVGVILMRGDGCILMGVRKGSHGAGLWSMPGGHVNFGEEPIETARREVLEETGLEVGAVEVFDALPYVNTHFAGEGKQYITLYFIAEYIGGEPKLCEPNKCQGWHWVDPQQLDGDVFEPEAYTQIKVALEQRARQQVTVMLVPYDLCDEQPECVVYEDSTSAIDALITSGQLDQDEPEMAADLRSEIEHALALRGRWTARECVAFSNGIVEIRYARKNEPALW